MHAYVPVVKRHTELTSTTMILPHIAHICEFFPPTTPCPSPEGHAAGYRMVFGLSTLNRDNKFKYQ